MKITKGWLEKHGACIEDIEYIKAEGLLGLPAAECIERLIELKKYKEANWLIAHVLNRENLSRYAVFTAYAAINTTDTTDIAACAAYAAKFAIIASDYAAYSAIDANTYMNQFDKKMEKIVKYGIKLIKLI